MPRLRPRARFGGAVSAGSITVNLSVLCAGARFDLWDECFNYQVWKDAFAKHGLDVEFLAQRQFVQDDILPWRHLGGPSADGLWQHYTDAMELAG